MTLYICEYEFNSPDKDNPKYSFHEIDFYAWIPYDKETPRIPNHRLSLRKNLETNRYEVYRFYFRRTMTITDQFILETGEPMGKEEVAFSSENLQEAIVFARNEIKRYHNHDDDIRPCEHKPLKRTMFCKAKG